MSCKCIVGEHSSDNNYFIDYKYIVGKNAFVVCQECLKELAFDTVCNAIIFDGLIRAFVCKDCYNIGINLIKNGTAIEPGELHRYLNNSCDNFEICCLDKLTPGARKKVIDTFDKNLEVKND